jgi:hypothetical protein
VIRRTGCMKLCGAIEAHFSNEAALGGPRRLGLDPLAGRGDVDRWPLHLCRPRRPGRPDRRRSRASPGREPEPGRGL